MKYLFLTTALSLALISCQESQNQETQETKEEETPQASENDLILEGEDHFSSLVQLTNGGDNAEAYFSFDDQNLVFQSNFADWGVECDQIFTMPVNAGAENPPMLSTGMGRTTCSYYYPDGKSILYGSTHLADESCPETPPFVQGKYVWPIYEGYDIFQADLEGNIIRQLTDEPGYDAEATISPQGDRIVFTSTRSGDLELWTCDLEGGDLQQITSGLGYDGGAFFSPDGSMLVFRASRPQTPEVQEEYKGLLAQGLVQPTEMEIYVCNADGTDLRQITDLGGANWAPYFTPDGQKVIFSSNHHSESKRQFNLFMIDLNGENLEQITFDETFDAFPMFSFDGTKLVFSSNRNNGGTRDTNVFLAEWKD